MARVDNNDINAALVTCNHHGGVDNFTLDYILCNDSTKVDWNTAKKSLQEEHY